MKESISQLHQVLFDKGIPFVRYSLPGDKKALTIISYHPVSFEDIDNIANQQDEGFIFAPFVPSADFPLWFFSADEIVDDSKNIQNLLGELKALPDVNKQVSLSLEPTSKKDYSKTFDKFMSRLKSKTLDKAILSKIVIQAKSKESLFSIFSRLSQTYPSAFTYLISLSSGDIWMGASPELLLSQDDSELKTMALAGTQLLENRPINEVQWERKEVEEQAYVRNYVEKVLTSVSKSVQVSETYSAKAGNLVHLRTDFSVNQNFDRLKTFTIVKKMHPTPAICGIPLAESRALILQAENHRRAYYTGFMGPINSDSISLFVNLRCMQVLPDRFALYVGGGITRDSDMEKEWAETEAKAQTLLSVIDVAKPSLE